MSQSRRDLAEALKEKKGGTIEQHDAWIDALLEVIIEKVSAGERIELRRFGSFEAREIQAHETKNPVTGKKMKNPKSYTVDFRPAEAFKEQLRESEDKDA
jgi:DNA-binding protein HU-beta